MPARTSEQQAHRNAFVEKLCGHVPLCPEDVQALIDACGTPELVPARRHLVREREKPGPVFVVLQGWACRSMRRPDGTRQITAFLLPGDAGGLTAPVVNEMEHSIETVTPALVATIPRAELDLLTDKRPAITRALWWAQIVDEYTLRAWIVSMGRRDKLQQVAHLLCDIFVRARAVGMATDGGRLKFPLNQIVLADALAMTPVHVNRVLQRLHADGLIEFSERSLLVRSVASLAVVAGFDDNHLHRRRLRVASLAN